MVVAAGALALAAAPAAQAAPRAQVAGGDTSLRLDRGVARALAGAGISVAPIDPANARGRRVLFRSREVA